ncbi:MAG TPA: SGNH/GDSL hydrolase family protein [Candidatus Udaeobacter sp.]|jgi:hypothetical protein|nr:SGNH/GDSL hydrolase family protein [Candidatus Udaeobacter sp.]
MKRLLANLGVLAVSAIASLLLVEVALRLLGFHPWFATPDPVIGDRLRAGARYRWTAEGFSEGRINSAGWRDHDYSEAKPPGTTRILFIGDSFVAGFEVPLDSTFHKRLERRLNADAKSTRFQVLALGEPGLGTTQEERVYETWGRRYDPDIVAVLFILNDWSDNWRWGGVPDQRPYFVPEGDSLRLDTSFVESADYRRVVRSASWKQHSSLLTLVAKIRQDLRARAKPDSAQAGYLGGHGWYGSWNFDRSPAADSIPAFDRTARILGRFAGEVRRDGRRFVLFAAGAAEIEARELIAKRANDPNFDPDKTRRFLEGVGARYGFEVVPLSPAFRESSARDGRRLWWGEGNRYGHWNPAGHAVAAGVMARYFEGAGDVPR